MGKDLGMVLGHLQGILVSLTPWSESHELTVAADQQLNYSNCNTTLNIEQPTPNQNVNLMLDGSESVQNYSLGQGQLVGEANNLNIMEDQPNFLSECI